MPTGRVILLHHLSIRNVIGDAFHHWMNMKRPWIHGTHWVQPSSDQSGRVASADTRPGTVSSRMLGCDRSSSTAPGPREHETTARGREPAAAPPDTPVQWFVETGRLVATSRERRSWYHRRTVTRTEGPKRSRKTAEPPPVRRGAPSRTSTKAGGQKKNQTPPQYQSQHVADTASRPPT
jgi:hypothetical protein